MLSCNRMIYSYQSLSSHKFIQKERILIFIFYCLASVHKSSGFSFGVCSFATLVLKILIMPQSWNFDCRKRLGVTYMSILTICAFGISVFKIKKNWWHQIPFRLSIVIESGHVIEQSWNDFNSTETYGQCWLVSLWYTYFGQRICDGMHNIYIYMYARVCVCLCIVCMFDWHKKANL